MDDLQQQKSQIDSSPSDSSGQTTIVRSKVTLKLTTSRFNIYFNRKKSCKFK